MQLTPCFFTQFLEIFLGHIRRHVVVINMMNIFLILRKQTYEISILSDGLPRKFEVVLREIEAIDITKSPSYVLRFTLVLLFQLKIIKYHQVLLVTA